MNNSQEYKYWFFFIKPEYLDLVYTEKDSLLYAYTDNKEYSKLFRSQRDMNKFVMIKRNIDRDEVNHLAKNFTREYIIKKEIKTKSKGIGSKIINYDLIITKTEENIIQNNAYKALTVDMWTSAWTSPYIFKDKYVKALDIIGLVDRYNIINSWKSLDKKVDKVGENIQPDYLSTFIRQFGFLLKSRNEDIK